jgi:NADP-dependent 3-hydroxy acid dehydrogenase YdfG
MTRTERPLAVVTGGSSGIGLALDRLEHSGLATSLPQIAHST